MRLGRVKMINGSEKLHSRPFQNVTKLEIVQNTIKHSKSFIVNTSQNNKLISAQKQRSLVYHQQLTKFRFVFKLTIINLQPLGK